MSAWAWALVSVLGLALVGSGILLYRRWPGVVSAREQAVRTRMEALRAANALGDEFFYAQAQMRRVARGRPSGPVIDGEVVDVTELS